jgi:hypothetical protein
LIVARSVRPAARRAAQNRSATSYANPGAAMPSVASQVAQPCQQRDVLADRHGLEALTLQVIDKPGSERPKQTGHPNPRHISHPDRLLSEQHVGDDLGQRPQIMYPASGADDAVCEDFSISVGHKPAVPMIAFAEKHLVVLCRFAGYAERLPGSPAGRRRRTQKISISLGRPEHATPSRACRVGGVIAGQRRADADDHDHRRDPREDHAAPAAVGDIGEASEVARHLCRSFSRAC